MSWVKLPDNFADDPRLEAAGPDAFVIHVAALCYCMRQLTDGILPARAARRLWSVDDVDAAITALVEHGLWKPTETGYEVVDFLETQRSAEVIRREQRLKAERQQRWYEKKRGGGNASVDASHSASKGASFDGSPAQPIPARNEVESGRAGSPGSAGATPVAPPPGVMAPPGPIKITIDTGDESEKDGQDQEPGARCRSCTRDGIELNEEGRCATCALVHEEQGARNG